ncbi:hypothetical protein GE061_020133 [Apolygus lucorum]|uniref:SUEL-type lectin domain-containing protein n=1 Tax=Apolygus lucorum TaxID=248454 RepID=A0A8S9WKE9_APOLU|nr:hypothetical protein GE061_020133 [Apolygus lucorum]
MLHLIKSIALALFAVYIANSLPNYAYTDYRKGWKRALACQSDRMTVSCTGGTVIQMKTAWYGKAVPHLSGCKEESESMPSGGCSTDENNIRLFRTACHGKQTCSVYKSSSDSQPCNEHKWMVFWYDCVPDQDLLETSPSTETPSNPVLGGFDENGRDLFVGRAFKNNDLLPCYVTPGSYCVFSNNDVTDGNNTFDYLVGGVVYANGPKYSWLQNHRGEVPRAAVTLGQTKDGDPLFVGRAEFGSGLYIGKVVPNQGLYIGLGGRSMFLDDYEILVQ